jgi:uncharacterized membrane protein
MKKYLPIIISIMALIVGIFIYPKMPDQVVSHWDSAGNADGYMGRFWGTFFLPLLMLGLTILLGLVPKIDPKRENIKKFLPYYQNFLIVFSLFMFAVYLQTLLWSHGIQINPIVFFSLGLAGLFYFTGEMIAHAEPNWMIGVRTAWTLSSESVWRKTNQLGGKLFKWSTLLFFLGALMPKYSIYFVFVPIVGLTGFLTLYSYWLYRKEQGK